MILEYPADKGTFPVDHSGGGMAFDAPPGTDRHCSGGPFLDQKASSGNRNTTGRKFLIPMR